MIRCECAHPSRDPHTGDRDRCVACGGWTPHGHRTPRGGFSETIAELHGVLDRIATDWQGFGDDPAPSRRGGTTTGSTDIAWSDPTYATAVAHHRAYIDQWLILCCRFLDRARLELLRADDAIGRALYAADPPPERLDGNWWDNIPVTDTAGADDTERARLLAAQSRRHARGEP